MRAAHVSTETGGEDLTPPDVQTLSLADGRDVPVSIRRSARARRILLHVGVYDGKVEIVLPPGATAIDGLGFASTQTSWVADQLSRIGTAVPFTDSATFPLLGKDVTIRLAEEHPARPALADDELLVGGRPDTLSGRVRRWIRNRALEEIKPRAHRMAAEIGKTPARVSMRDTRSRWGSCSRDGNLNFSWRLVMAPDWVLDYVVAHEVAHLQELNHSDRFWAVVDGLSADSKPARKWLRVNGADLHRYGREAVSEI